MTKDFIFDPSLVLYLPLYQLDGASFKSEDAYGHLATVTGALWRPQGRWFDKSDDRIIIGAMSNLNVGTGDMSFIAWGRCDVNIADAQILTRGDHGGSGSPEIAWGGYVASGNVTVHWRNAAGTHKGVSTGINLNTWYCVTGVRSAQTVYGFLNGESMGAGTTGADMNLTGHQQTVIGAGASGAGYDTYFGGTIGEVWIYTRALAPSEIQRRYLATKWRYR